MKKLLSKRKIQKIFLPISFFCIIPLWLLLKKGVSQIPPIAYVFAVIAAISFWLDRLFKPWDVERAEKTMEKSSDQSKTT